MKLLPKSWVGFGVLSLLAGLLLLFGTDAWHWLGAVGVVAGLVLVLMGPPGGSAAASGDSTACAGGHSCCLPRELAGDAASHRSRRRPTCAPSH